MTNESFNFEFKNVKLLRAKELSVIFVNISQATYNAWYEKGILPRYKIGGSVFYALEEVCRLIQDSREYKKEAFVWQQ